MRYREIGNTGLRASEIGFGCGDNAGLVCRATTEERRTGIARALELGINYFDTSPDYGKGISEANLGRAFKALDVRPIVATKVEIMPGDEDDFAAAVMRSVDGSLRRLGMDHVDILQIHNAPDRERDLKAMGWVPLSVDDYLGPKGCLEGLERAKREGKARFLGFACENADATAVKALLDTGAFSQINVWYDLTNPTAGSPAIPGLRADYEYGQIIDYAQSHGVGTATIRPLAGGTLTDAALATGARHPYAGGGLSRGSRYQQMVDQARSMGFLSQPGNHTLAQAAVRWVLMHPGVTTVLGGFSELSQIEEMAGCSGAGPLSDENLARIEMAWRANFGRWEE